MDIQAAGKERSSILMTKNRPDTDLPMPGGCRQKWHTAAFLIEVYNNNYNCNTMQTKGNFHGHFWHSIRKDRHSQPNLHDSEPTWIKPRLAVTSFWKSPDIAPALALKSCRPG
ncbi:MAG: hypothetical protein RR311_04300 [Comamonas sp.]